MTKSNSNLPKAILFDHDGVLVTSEQLHFLAWQQMLRGLSLPYEKIEFQKYVGRPAPLILEMILNEFRPDWKREDYDLDALAKLKNDIYLEMAETRLTTYPGVIEGLEWLKSVGISAAVVSNARRRELMFSMDTLKLKPYFDVVISRDDALRPKPDPAPFELAAVSLGFEPRQCMAIDDTPTGLEAGWRAGCRLASVTTSYREDELRSAFENAPGFKFEIIAPQMDAFFNYLKSLV